MRINHYNLKQKIGWNVEVAIRYYYRTIVQETAFFLIFEPLKQPLYHVFYVIQVSYSNRVEDYLPLPIPLEKATNEEEFQKYEARKQEADAKGVKYVILVLLITFLRLFNSVTLLFLNLIWSFPK